jgi:hypothetical protein
VQDETHADRPLRDTLKREAFVDERQNGMDRGDQICRQNCEQ